MECGINRWIPIPRIKARLKRALKGGRPFGLEKDPLGPITVDGEPAAHIQKVF